MREEYYEIYKDLYDWYRSASIGPTDWNRLPPFFQPEYPGFKPLRWVTDAIETASSDLRLTRRLRPDAKHFLLVNLHQMAALPIADPRNATTPPVDQVHVDFQEDATKILSEAREEAGPEGEITTGKVLRVTSNLWDGLRLNRLDLWG